MAASHNGSRLNQPRFSPPRQVIQGQITGLRRHHIQHATSMPFRRHLKPSAAHYTVQTLTHWAYVMHNSYSPLPPSVACLDVDRRARSACAPDRSSWMGQRKRRLRLAGQCCKGP
jgi:hypothetical protein